MKQRGWGRIVNMSSSTLNTVVTNYAHYIASKGGVVGFTRALASEFGPFGVTVNAISPSLTRSPGTLSRAPRFGRANMDEEFAALATLGDAANLVTASEMGQVQEAARTLGLEIVRSEIRRAEDIAPAIEALKGRADALYVQSDPLMNTNRMRISILALGARLPTLSGIRDYVEAGGLMSYGPNFPDISRRAGDYVDKILRGTKPADFPIQAPTKFELVLNLKTAKALGLEIPPTLLARADEVIE